MIKLCKNCGKEFEAVRDTATYCSAKCRKLAFPKVSVPDNKKVSVPITGEQVEWSGETIQHDPRLKHSDIPDGYCKGCGERQSNKDCDICYKCIAKGCTRASLGLKITERQAWLNGCQA